MTQIAERTQAPLRTVGAGCLAVLLAQMTFSMPSALNGTFQQEFATSGSQLTWIAAAFAIPMVVLQLTTGVAGDRLGRRRLLQVGALLTVLGSLTVSVADTVQVVWAGQVVAGLGAAVLYPLSLAMVLAASPTSEARARAIALWAGTLSIGAALAPAMAGAMADAGRWRASYVVVAVVALASVALTQRAADSSNPDRRSLDLPGQVTLALGLGAVLFAVVQGVSEGFDRAAVVVALLAGAALLVAFGVVERRADEPLVPLALLADRRFALVALVTVLGMTAFLAITYTTSVWVGAIEHQGALRVGLLVVLAQAPALVLVPVVARRVLTASPRWVLSAGFALMAASGLWCSTFDAQEPSWSRFVAPMLCLGIGFALTLGTLTAVAVEAVPTPLAAMAGATAGLLRNLGLALAPLVVTAVAAGRADDSLDAGLAQAVGGSGLQPPYTDIAGGIAHQGGAMALNALPVVPGAGELPPVPMPASLHLLALESLGDAYSLAFLVAGLCAAAAALLALAGLRAVTSGSSRR